LVYTSPSNQAIKIASGNDHVALLTANGDIITFGCAEQGQLGRVPEIFSARGGRKGIQFLLKPTPIRFRKTRNFPSPRFKDLFCGSYHTFGLTEDEAVYSWGLNNYGQLGTGDVESRFQPERLPADWIKEDETDGVMGSPRGCLRYKGLVISGGQHHSVLCNKGSVYVMGRKDYGRLGLGPNSSLEPTTPTRVPGLDRMMSVSASTVCSFAVSEGGELYSWGMGTNLQLGTGEEEDVWTPHKVAGKKIEGKKVLDCSAGGQHTALIAK
jgi:regulator of chromosome condensation